MNIDDFNELTKKRIAHIESCRLNGDNSHSIIANLYSDSTHFLYELLQNAQDAGATTILFELYPDRLESSHNGRAFSFFDVEAITTIGSSTKSNEPNKIGKFGAGFKSVFSITNTPHIYGDTYNFKISDYIIPKSIEPLENRNDGYTTVILPFDRVEANLTTHYDSIAKRLRTIGKDELIFLSNLSRIDWKIGDEVGYVEKTVEKNEGIHSLLCINTQSKTEYFELYTHEFSIEDKALECKIAFAMDAEGKYIPVSVSPLYVFFQTVVATNVRFLVHAPYKTTPNRETINFDDPQNEAITENIVELYKNILIDMAKRKVLDVQILQLLPLSSQSGKVAQKLFAASIEIFKSQPLIPTQDGGYALPSEIFAVAQGTDASLFEEAGTHKLFQKSAWLHSSLLESKYNTIKCFLTAYAGMMEYTLDKIIQQFDDNFLSAQSNDWIASFYGECAKNQLRVNGFLSSLPLARLEDGTHVAFKSANGEVQIYLYPQTPTRFRCVHPDISASDIAKPFFDAIAIKTPDIVDEIKEFILPLLTNLGLTDGYFEAFSALSRMYDAASESNQKKIVELIEKSACIFCISDGVKKLKYPHEVYLPTKQLKRWFVASPAASTMDEKLWGILDGTTLGSLLSFKTRPDVLPTSPHIDQSHKERLRHTALVAELDGDDFELDGLGRLLDNPVDKELSLVIWEFLISHLKDKNILRGYYRWRGAAGNSHEKDFDSKICTLLKNAEWVFDADSTAHKPMELKLEEIAEEYGYDLLGVEIKEYLALMSFKTDAIEELEKQGLKVVTLEEYEALKKLQQKQSSEVEDIILWEHASPDTAKWTMEVEAKTAEVRIETTKFKAKKSKDLQKQTSRSFFEDAFDEEHYAPVVPKAIRKAIGEWSEEYVYRYLQEFCENNKDKRYSVRRMNEGANIGRGYDFVLMRGDEELRYIEVKGRASNTNEFEISKTQWGFAKFLYDSGEGYKYAIFVIKNAGTTSASLTSINNPVKMWLDGDLEIARIELSYS